VTDHSSNNRPGNTVRYAEGTSVNEAYNHFLGIRDEDRSILKRHYPGLIEDSEEFAEVFYSYLLAYPATAAILERYREQGGEIKSLVRTQLDHLRHFLSGDTGNASATRLAEAGAAHQRFGIEPV